LSHGEGTVVSLAGGTRRSTRPSARIAWRVGLVVTLILVAVFAVQGGEYSTQELLLRTRRRAALELEVRALERVVDSLTAEKQLVEKDDATVERIAREEYGMVKGSRELLYRFADEVDDDGTPQQ